jgi:hypothetical protein
MSESRLAALSPRNDVEFGGSESGLAALSPRNDVEFGGDQ